MNNKLKMLMRKLFYGGSTKKLYEKISSIKTASRSGLSDEELIRLKYKENVGGVLNLENPVTLTDKLNWLKLHCKNPEYTKMVDKYAVKDYVTEKVGAKYVIPIYGVWDHFDEIDFDKLPNSFVLKVTHNSGGLVIVKDKEKLDKKAAGKKLEDCLKINYYTLSREYPYKDVPPRIIAEKYVPSLGNADSVEYKLTLMNGKVKFITVCKGPAHDSFDVRTNDHYDREGKILPFYAFYKNANPPIPLPPETDEMIEVAEKLGADIPYVRVDLYVNEGNVLFGEMTFFTWGGFIQFTPKEWDKKLGEWLTLPKEG